MSFLAFLAFVGLLFVVGRLYQRLLATEERLGKLTDRLRKLEKEEPREPGVASANASETATVVTLARTMASEATRPSPPVAVPKPPAVAPITAGVPPPLPADFGAARAAAWATSGETMPSPAPAPPPPPKVPKSEPLEAEPPSLPGLTLEAFMGVKLFAWLGGLALFLGIAFFVRYSFEHNLITPQMRVAIGALAGLGLIGGGLWMPRPKFAVTAQTLCATGIVTLYAVTFGAYSLYHFLGLPAAFAIMTVITAMAFILAVWIDAQVVAILGLLGGFLTPLLLSTGEDNATGLFTYLAILDVGLIAVALRKRWMHLVALAAVATAVMQAMWVISFFAAARVGVGAVIFLGFEALFLVPFWWSNRDAAGEPWTTRASGVSAAAALVFAAYLLGFAELGQKPWVCLSILLAADAGLVMWPVRRNALQRGPLYGGGAAFLVLSIWNGFYLNDALLHWALGYFLIFAAFHTALPLLLRRLRPMAATPRWVSAFPALGLVLMLWPALRIGASTALWAAVLVADLAAIALAAVTASLLGVVAALVLTLVAGGLWLVQTPVDNPEVGGLLVVIAGFAALFCGASVFLQKFRRPQGAAPAGAGREAAAFDHLPAISAILPFVLLVSVVHRLHPVNPSAIFGVGMLLVVMILALARWSRTPGLPAVALFCAALLEYSWHWDTQPGPTGWLPLEWYLGFTAVVFAFPVLFQSRQTAHTIPWATAALAPVVHYPLIQDVIRHTWPGFRESAGGLVPAAFSLPLLGIGEFLRRRLDAGNPARLGVLAWFGGVALCFITLIFPVQFEREWLTISWALEGAALLWLFHRVPHPGLRFAGFGLLCVAFVRLSINPAVLEYHARSGVPIWNWYLYTYGIGAGCFFAGGWLTAPPRDRLGEFSLPATFYSLGTVLLFLLLNIEIADYFSTTATLTFDFESNLARDMTYSIAWSLFGLALLLIGMHRQLAAVRYAGIGLLLVTLAKLFLHDLAQLDQLYRIGAFVAVAIVLIGSSYLYQRFLAVDKKEPPKEL